MTDEEAQKLLGAIQQQNASANAEMRRHFDETAERIASTTRHHFELSTEAFKHENRLIAEGLVSLGERVSREIGRLDEKVDQGFANTQAMIRFSHAELEKRVRTIEEELSDLRSRVDRLETATH